MPPADGGSVQASPSASGSGGPSCVASSNPRGAWPSVHADFLRRQAEFFNGPDSSAPYGIPFSESSGVKHTPYITLDADGRTGRVFVGKEGGAYHPMIGASVDGEDPHWITELYVVDGDTGEIIAMDSLDPTGADNATMAFGLPAAARKLVAYGWCNIHGLWVGPAVEVDASVAAAAAAEVERKDVECAGEERVFTTTLDCTFVADGGEFPLKRRRGGRARRACASIFLRSAYF